VYTFILQAVIAMRCFVTKCNRVVTSIVIADNLGKARNGRNGVTLGVKW